MLLCRFQHAIYYAQDREEIYVFGGHGYREKAMNRSERYSFSKDKWKLTRPMLKPRKNFNACRADWRIFLCGGEDKSIETFDMRSGSFQMLNIAVGVCSAYISEEELVLVTRKSVRRMNLRSEEIVSKAKISTAEEVKLGYHSVVIHRNVLYTMVGEACVGVHLDSGLTETFPVPITVKKRKKAAVLAIVSKQ